ncbi:MAG: hypothetical protein C0617_04920 [Desulfuromonas sp.]|uniref:alpha/beta hydrolase n=1 Tax=Desulfuromonas sp. TaxID=892 RepID=UPI000CB2C57C|nr:alpha/beta fold hydrolase [Desulfuromonas sp.]PLX85233.1 MAG: hypothetical protein C0617_04920 [Desulfuromonas sp.]
MEESRKIPPAPWRALSRCVMLLALLTLFACLPRERYLFSTDRTIGFPAPSTGLAFEEVVFPARDGCQLYGRYLPGPPGRPLVLYLYGTGTNLSHLTEPLRLLQGMEASIFVFDYRGYGQSAGEPSERGTYDDARGALDYLRSRGWEPGSTIYYGHSLGAAVALQLALEEPPAGLVLESPFTSVLAMICHHVPFSCDLLRQAYGRYYDNLAKIGRIHAPLLIFQGERDTIVPVEMARQLFARANEPKYMHILPGASHSDLYLTGGLPYRESWRTFIDQAAAQKQQKAAVR